MIPISTFAGQRVAVFGLGASGNSTVAALQAGGAIVSAWDDSEAGREASAKAGVPIVDLRASDWDAFAALILAPGVPLTHPEPHWTVVKAIAAGIEIIGDVELFCRERAATCPDAPFIAITGTNGKSTTTALIAHLLTRAGYDVQLGGNIGRAVLTLEPPARNRIHVIELSSFQIDLAPRLKPGVGVVLNITPDHLDRHGTLENYAAVKERLVAGSDVAVVGVEDELSRAIAARSEARGQPLRRVKSLEPHAGEYGLHLNAVAYADANGQLDSIASLNGIGSLRGRHNAQNAVAAYAATKDFIKHDDYQNSFSTFPGLAHRMEEIGRIGRVLFINDSKATNADSAEKALTSWPGGIFWIVGGKAKDGGIEPLRDYFPRVVKAYLIGEATEAFASQLGSAVSVEKCGVLEVAVAKATADAAASSVSEPVVLLSPACASYDQYKNFEQRGDHFRRLVMALPGFDLKS